MKKVLFVMLLAMSSLVAAKTIIVIEEPRQDEVAQGVGNIRGFVVSDDQVLIAKYYINGVDKGTIPFGGKRGDVSTKYPGYPTALESGFSTVFNWGLLDDDLVNEITIQVLTSKGDVYEESVLFDVVRFNGQKDWVTDAVVDFANIVPTDNGFMLENVMVGDVVYKQIEFEWNSATQSFSIVEID